MQTKIKLKAKTFIAVYNSLKDTNLVEVNPIADNRAGLMWQDTLSKLTTPTVSSGSDINELAEHTAALNRHTLSNDEEFAKSYKELLGVVKTSLEASISIYRDEVKPAIERTLASVKADVVSAVRLAGEDDVSVTFVTVPKLVTKNPGFFKLDKYNGVGESNAPKVTSTLEAMYYDWELIYKSMGDFMGNNKHANEFLARINLEGFSNYGRSIFITPKKDEMLNDYEKLDRATVGILVAEYLLENTADVKIPLHEYESYLNSIVANLAVTCLKTLRAISRDVDTNTIIIERTHSTAVLNNKTYTKWVNNGSGSIETILGCVISNGKERTAGALAKKAVTYAATWSNHNSLARAKMVNNKHRAIRNALSHIISNLVTDKAFSITEKKWMLDHGVSATYIYSNTKKVIEELTNKELDDLPHAVMKVVTLGRYYFTNSFEFFSTMESYANTSGDEDPKAAMLYATANESSRYIADILNA